MRLAGPIAATHFLFTALVLVPAYNGKAQSPETQLALLVDSVKYSLVNGQLSIPEQYYYSANDLGAYIEEVSKISGHRTIDTLRFTQFLTHHKSSSISNFKELIERYKSACPYDFTSILSNRRYIIVAESGRNGVPSGIEIFVRIPGYSCEGHDMVLRIEDCFWLNGQLKLGDNIKIERKKDLLR